MKQPNENELRRKLETDTAAWRALQNERSALEDQIRQLEMPRLNALDPSPAFRAANKTAVKAFEAGQEERAAAAEKAKRSLGEVDRQLAKLTSGIEVLNRQLAEAEVKAATEMRQRAARAVEDAAAKAPGREAFFSARTKLSELQSQLSKTERELQTLLTSNRGDPATMDEKVDRLLDTGELPTQAQSDLSAEAKKLVESTRVLAAAVRVQEARMLKAQAEFARQVDAALRPAKQDVASRIDTGMIMARQATMEARLIQVAFAVATGGPADALECFVYGGLPFPIPGDSFAQWQDAMRRAGLL